MPLARDAENVATDRCCFLRVPSETEVHVPPAQPLPACSPCSTSSMLPGNPLALVLRSSCASSRRRERVYRHAPPLAARERVTRPAAPPCRAVGAAARLPPSDVRCSDMRAMRSRVDASLACRSAAPPSVAAAAAVASSASVAGGGGGGGTGGGVGSAGSTDSRPARDGRPSPASDGRLIRFRLGPRAPGGGGGGGGGGGCVSG